MVLERLRVLTTDAAAERALPGPLVGFRRGALKNLIGQRRIGGLVPQEHHADLNGEVQAQIFGICERKANVGVGPASRPALSPDDAAHSFLRIVRFPHNSVEQLHDHVGDVRQALPMGRRASFRVPSCTVNVVEADEASIVHLDILASENGEGLGCDHLLSRWGGERESD